MIKVLFASFINTGLLLLLLNSNFEYAPGILNQIPFRNQYVDMDYNWYNVVATQLVFTMIFTAIFPWIELALLGGIAQLFRLNDKGYCCRSKKKKTKCTTQK